MELVPRSCCCRLRRRSDWAAGWLCAVSLPLLARAVRRSVNGYNGSNGNDNAAVATADKQTEINTSSVSSRWLSGSKKKGNDVLRGERTTDKRIARNPATSRSRNEEDSVWESLALHCFYLPHLHAGVDATNNDSSDAHVIWIYIYIYVVILIGRSCFTVIAVVVVNENCFTKNRKRSVNPKNVFPVPDGTGCLRWQS